MNLFYLKNPIKRMIFIACGSPLVNVTLISSWPVSLIKPEILPNIFWPETPGSKV